MSYQLFILFTLILISSWIVFGLDKVDMFLYTVGIVLCVTIYKKENVAEQLI